MTYNPEEPMICPECGTVENGIEFDGIYSFTCNSCDHKWDDFALSDEEIEEYMKALNCKVILQGEEK